MRYRVTWEVDVEADHPEEAATKALAIQRDKDSKDVCFTVLWFDDENCGQVDIDLCPTMVLPPVGKAREAAK